MKTGRGIEVFTKLLFDEEVLSFPIDETHGRNAELHQRRNTLLFHRFYYKSKIEGKQYHNVLAELKEEFFLSKAMLQKIIQSNADAILLLKKQPPSSRELKEKWNWLTW